MPLQTTITSPNMGLTLPIPGVDPGPDYALNNNASFLTVDGHNHTQGSGVQIPPAGLNINSALTFQNNQATNLQASVYTPQSTLSTLDAVYVSGVDLYYNDGNGNAVRITQGGSVTGASGTITGLPSGTAGAAYNSVSGTFIFTSASLTAANIDGASYILRNATASSKGLTLAPPAAMAANYTLTLPNLPTATSWLQVDTSGDITASTAVSGGLTSSNLSSSAGITGTQLAANTITASQIANNTITTTQISNSAGITNGQLAAVNINTSASISGSSEFIVIGNASATPQIIGPCYSCTFTIANPGVVNVANSALFTANQAIYFPYEGSATYPTGITTITTYYVKTITSGTSFTISATPGGTAIAFTGSSSGSTYVVQPTGMQCTLTTVGRPVYITLQNSSITPSTGFIECNPFGQASSGCEWQLIRDGTVIAQTYTGVASTSASYVAPAAISFIDTTASAGSHTYQIAVIVEYDLAGITMTYVNMLAYEL